MIVQAEDHAALLAAVQKEGCICISSIHSAVKNGSALQGWQYLTQLHAVQKQKGSGLLSAPRRRWEAFSERCSERCPKPFTILVATLAIALVLIIGFMIGHFAAPYFRTMVCHSVRAQTCANKMMAISADAQGCHHLVRKPLESTLLPLRRLVLCCKSPKNKSEQLDAQLWGQGCDWARHTQCKAVSLASIVHQRWHHLGDLAHCVVFPYDSLPPD